MEVPQSFTSMCTYLAIVRDASSSSIFSCCIVYSCVHAVQASCSSCQPWTVADTRSRAHVIWRMLAWCLFSTALPALSQVHLSCVCQTVPSLLGEVPGTLPGFTCPTLHLCNHWRCTFAHIHIFFIHTLPFAGGMCFCHVPCSGIE